MVSKAYSVFLTDLAGGIEFLGYLLIIVKCFLRPYPRTNKIFHTNFTSFSRLLIKILIDIAMAGYDLHTQLIHIFLELFIRHAPEHTLSAFKAFNLLIPKACHL